MSDQPYSSEENFPEDNSIIEEIKSNIEDAVKIVDDVAYSFIGDRSFPKHYHGLLEETLVDSFNLAMQLKDRELLCNIATEIAIKFKNYLGYSDLAFSKAINILQISKISDELKDLCYCKLVVAMGSLETGTPTIKILKIAEQQRRYYIGQADHESSRDWFKLIDKVTNKLLVIEALVKVTSIADESNFGIVEDIFLSHALTLASKLDDSDGDSKKNIYSTRQKAYIIITSLVGEVRIPVLRQFTEALIPFLPHTNIRINRYLKILTEASDELKAVRSVDRDEEDDDTIDFLGHRIAMYANLAVNEITRISEIELKQKLYLEVATLVQTHFPYWSKAFNLIKFIKDWEVRDSHYAAFAHQSMGRWGLEKYTFKAIGNVSTYGRDLVVQNLIKEVQKKNIRFRVQKDIKRRLKTEEISMFNSFCVDLSISEAMDDRDHEARHYCNYIIDEKLKKETLQRIAEIQIGLEHGYWADDEL